jgi:hypothetical protein
MHRPTVGVLALVLLALGVALQFGAPEQWNAMAWAGAFIRVGSILGIIWFALPELGTGKSRWLVVAIVAGVLILALRPRYFVLALAIMIALAILRPRLKTGWPDGARRS